MLVHILNIALRSHNGTSLEALRMKPFISIPVGFKVLNYNIVDAWCIERSRGGLYGDYGSIVTAFCEAWKLRD